MSPQETICDQVVVALRSIARALDLHYKFLLREYGLSGPQIVVLKAIRTMGPCPVSEVSQDVHLSHATVTEIVHRLARKGLVSRAYNAQDRRQVIVLLTPTGEETADRAPTLLHEKFVAEFTALDLWEQNHILASLQRVAGMIGVSSRDRTAVLSIAPLVAERNPASANPDIKTKPRKRKRTANIV